MKRIKKMPIRLEGYLGWCLVSLNTISPGFWWAIAKQSLLGLHHRFDLPNLSLPDPPVHPHRVDAGLQGVLQQGDHLASDGLPNVGEGRGALASPGQALHQVPVGGAAHPQGEDPGVGAVGPDQLDARRAV